MMKVAVMVYDGVKLVDMCGPTDVFLHANGIQQDSYHLYAVAESKQPVRSEGAVVTILPAYDFGDCPEPDILIVPDLLDADLVPTVASDACVAFIKSIVLKNKIILSVCVGLFNVAATGLLGGKRVTTHYLALPSFQQQQHPDMQVVKNKRVVQDGSLVSTGGITSGIDGALHLLESLQGGAIAQQVADIMVYNRAAPLPEYTLLPPYDPRP